MYDDNSEVSIDYRTIEKTNEKFKETYNANTLYDLVARYIKENKEIFVN